MNNIKEDIEKILDRYFASREYYSFKGIRDELETYINKVREEAVINYINNHYGKGFESIAKMEVGRYLQSLKETKDLTEEDK